MTAEGGLNPLRAAVEDEGIAVDTSAHHLSQEWIGCLDGWAYEMDTTTTGLCPQIYSRYNVECVVARGASSAAMP